jgi:hypothetical protein
MHVHRGPFEVVARDGETIPADSALNYREPYSGQN